MFLNQAPFSFDLSVMDLYGSLATGGTLFSLTKEHVANLKLLYDALAEAGVTTLGVDAFVRADVPDRADFARGCCRGCGGSSSAARRSRRKRPRSCWIASRRREVWNTYGPTEATVATTSIRIDRDVIANAIRRCRWARRCPARRSSIRGEDQQRVAEGERGRDHHRRAEREPGLPRSRGPDGKGVFRSRRQAGLPDRRLGPGTRRA